jgi:hypothetical protein
MSPHEPGRESGFARPDHAVILEEVNGFHVQTTYSDVSRKLQL